MTVTFVAATTGLDSIIIPGTVQPGDWLALVGSCATGTFDSPIGFADDDGFAFAPYNGFFAHRVAIGGDAGTTFNLQTDMSTVDPNCCLSVYRGSSNTISAPAQAAHTGLTTTGGTLSAAQPGISVTLFTADQEPISTDNNQRATMNNGLYSTAIADAAYTSGSQVGSTGTVGTSAHWYTFVYILEPGAAGKWALGVAS